MVRWTDGRVPARTFVYIPDGLARPGSSISQMSDPFARHAVRCRLSARAAHVVPTFGKRNQEVGVRRVAARGLGAAGA